MSKTYRKLLPVLFSFFVMGFVDVVGVSTSYIKVDFDLNDKFANLLPMMVFLWFAICSLPTSKLMNKIGRKNTVIISAVITLIGMLLPIISYTFLIVLTAFAMLGIGNTILQVSLNPLLVDITEDDKMTSMLTFGQFIKAISSTLGPVIAGAAAGYFGSWKLIFPVYAFLILISLIWLRATNIEETKRAISVVDNNKIWSLFKDKYLLMLLSIIALIVGFEVGLMTAVPKFLLERFNIPLDKGGLGCSLYFIARMASTFLGAIVLSKISSRKFLIYTMALAIIVLVVFMSFHIQAVILISLFLLGLLCANVFAIVFSAALQYVPAQANEISAMMIMGVAGGALIPPAMGIIADMSNQFVSLFVLLLTLGYIFRVSFKVKIN